MFLAVESLYEKFCKQTADKNVNIQLFQLQDHIGFTNDGSEMQIFLVIAV